MALAKSGLEVRKYVGGFDQAAIGGAIGQVSMYSFHPRRILSRSRAPRPVDAIAASKNDTFSPPFYGYDIVASNIVEWAARVASHKSATSLA